MDEALRYLWGPAYTAHCIEVALDPWRAIAWIATNLAVTVAYFGIPIEIGRWARAMSLSLSGRVALMFRLFIFMCGVSHLAMILVMPTANWLFIILVFAPLALVSMGVYLALRRYRRRIVAVLAMARELLNQARIAERERRS